LTVLLVNDPFWGDCGKGWAVSKLAPYADIIVRYNGGPNAGHSVPHKGTELNYHQIPSGLHLGKECIIGNGVVFNPDKFFGDEIPNLVRVEHSMSMDTLHLSDLANVTMPYHILQESLDEMNLALYSGEPIGTTGNGIGQTYSDKVSREFALLVRHLLNKDVLAKKLNFIVPYKNNQIAALQSYLKTKITGKYLDAIDKEKREKTIRVLEQGPFSADEMTEKYYDYGCKLRPFVTNTVVLLNSYIEQGKNILLEGAQGGGLDIDHCNDHPNCTSSNTIAGSACTGAGISPDKIDFRMGVGKAYCSRVGSGYFPTEFKGELADIIRERGKEYGRSTGRPRRIGWFDGGALRLGKMLNGYNGYAIVGMNVLAGLNNLKFCTHYENGNPFYVPIASWPKIDAAEVERRGLEAFPEEAKAYLDMISQIGDAPICMVTYDFGKDIILRNPFEK
jgi:adenylosuccinate synthase